MLSRAPAPARTGYAKLPSATILCGLLVAGAGTLVQADNSNVDDTSPACCASRTRIVPVLTYVVDIGIPVGLLVSFFFLLRARRTRLAAQGSRADPGGSAHPPLSQLVDIGDDVDRTPSLQLDAACRDLPSPRRTRLAFWLAGLWDPSKKLQASTVDAGTDASLARSASLPVVEVLRSLQTAVSGLSPEEAAIRLQRLGRNKLSEFKQPSIIKIGISAIIQPFNFLMATVAALTVSPPNNDQKTFAMIMFLLVFAIVLRFIEEVRSVVTAKALNQSVVAHTLVVRNGCSTRVDIEEVVPGDVVRLSAGDLIPGDLRVLEAVNLFIGTSTLTGEAMPVEKRPTTSTCKTPVLEHTNLCLMSTHVVSGTGLAVVLATGKSTYIANIARMLTSGRAFNAFDRAVRRIVYVFMLFIAVMVPVVIVLNGTSTGDWHGATVFGLAVAVGLTPQMLPMIVTANLAKGANAMRAKKTVVRRLDAVQNLGGMDILCTDKTGTLTVDEVTLVRYLDANGKTSDSVLKLAYANSYFQAGVPNLLDKGVIAFAMAKGLCAEVQEAYECLDEVPFDFERRLLSVLLRDANDAGALPMLVCKGALDELLAVCTHVLEGDMTFALDDERRMALMSAGDQLSSQGLRVLGLAVKSFSKPQADFSRTDESDMTFNGFLAFLDPPKLSAIPAIKAFYERGVTIKVLTGDSLIVARRLCTSMGIPADHCVTGAQLAQADIDTLQDICSHATVFAKVSPQQKMQIVATLQKLDHVVGFLGDGTNDALALRKADVGVSVDSASDVAKEASDLVMLEKDLEVLNEGVLTGRITYGNTIKYIKFASSSSFGNTFSVLAAAAWLPFTPLEPVQFLALNLLYNISQMAIPWDTMDASFLEKPKRWNAKFLGVYMLIVGPISSLFDMTTFLIMFFAYHCNNNTDAKRTTFQSAWFLESLMTQTFIVHLLRTERWPFLQSRAAWPLMLSSFGTMAVGIAICYIPGITAALQLAPPPPTYYAYLALTVAAYCLTVQVFKKLYIGVFKTWL